MARILEMDPGDGCATPRSGSGGKGGLSRSASTSSRRRRRRLMPSSRTRTQLMAEFNAAGDAGGSAGSSSPPPPSSGSRALDLEGVILQATTPAATDNTIIVEGELLGDATRRSASLVVNNGLGTCAGRSISVDDNNGPSSRVSVSDLDLVLLASGSQGQGSSGGGSGGRRSGSNDQFPQREGGRYAPRPWNNRHYEAGSSSRQQPAPGSWQGAGLPNFSLPLGFIPAWAAVPGFAAGLYVPTMYPPLEGAPSMYPPLEGVPTMYPPLEGVPSMYPPLEGAPSMYPPFEDAPSMDGEFEVLPKKWPPDGVTIRHPPTSSGDPPPLPEPPTGARVTIRAPPASERASSSAPKQPEPTPPAPTPEPLETRPPQPVPSLRWPPRPEVDALITRWLYGPSGRSRRLPVFENIWPGDESRQHPPPPPPPPPSQPAPRSP